MALNPKGVREMKVVIFNQKINLLFLIYVLTVSCKFFSEMSKLKFDVFIWKSLWAPDNRILDFFIHIVYVVYGYFYTWGECGYDLFYLLEDL